MSRSRTVGRAAGRVLLWLALLAIVARGAYGLLLPPSQIAEGTPPSPAEAAARDQAEVAFAVGFARAYFTFEPGEAAAHAEALATYLAPGLDEHAGLELPDEGPAQAVAQATLARAHRIGPDVVLVTLAVELAAPRRRTVYLSVPVGRDPAGGLAVVDYPAVTSPPERGELPLAASGEPLPPDLRPGVEALLERFFPAYLAGATAELTYFLPPGTRLQAVAAPWSDVALLEVGVAEAPRAGRLLARATVRARDEATGALHLLRYRLELVRAGRWYVAALDPDPKGA